MDNQIYRWSVKKGNILVQRNEYCISLQVDYENGDCCLLTHTDVDEITDFLTIISRQIWEDPNYVKKAYTNRLYKVNQNEYSWNVELSQLSLRYNEIENAIEIKYRGSGQFNLEINCAIEVIQILEQLNK